MTPKFKVGDELLGYNGYKGFSKVFVVTEVITYPSEILYYYYNEANPRIKACWSEEKTRKWTKLDKALK